MLIYEVNLTVNNAIFSDYYLWLVEHVREMLQFPGFKAAEMAKEISLDKPNADVTKLTVRYTVESENDLDNYFNHHAAVMREEGIRRFGYQFSAARRVFVEPLSWSK